MITLETSHPSPDWQRMALLVGELLTVHPILQPLRSAGEIVDVEASPRAIWAKALSAMLVVQIQAPDWWMPRRETAEDRARHLSQRLAIEMRRAWERHTSTP